jgi:hypothetical protein
MKIGHWKQAHSWMTRPDTRSKEEIKAMETKQKAAEVNRKNKKRQEYGLKPLVDPNKFVELTNLYDGNNFVVDDNGQITDEASLKKRFENEVVNKAKELSEDKIITKQRPVYPKEATPEQVGQLAERMERARQINGGDGRYNKTKPKKKNPVISVPISNMPVPYIPEPITRTPEDIKLEENFNKMVRESEEKKISNQNSGLANLLGGSKAYD